MQESSSDDQFRVLQREIRESIRRNHPNPERVGCVGTEKLAAMARGALGTDNPAYSHVMECSPCYEELMTLTEQVNSQRAGRRWRVPAFAAAAAVLAAIVAVWLFTRGLGKTANSPITPEPPQIADNRPPAPPPDLPVSVLNLESETPTRGSEASPAERGLQRLPRRRMALMIYLPLGMDEGQYEVEVARPNSLALIHLTGIARIENGLTTLRVQPDFSTLEPGRYELRYRRPKGEWRESAFSLR